MTSPTLLRRSGFRLFLIVLALLGMATLAGLALAQEGARTHVVETGQTLTEIAALYGVTVEAIVEANDLPDADSILPGQALIIPAADGGAGQDVGADVAPAAEPQATEEPDEDAAPVQAVPAVQGRPTTYVVQPRDTIDTIAQRLNVQPRALIQANFGPGENPNRIFAGRVLNIPANAPPYPFPPGVTPPAPAEGIGGGGRGPDESYTVQPGDYLESIAIDLDVAVESIIYANDLRAPYVLMAGDVLNIPGDAPPFGVVPPDPDQPGAPAVQPVSSGLMQGAEGIGGGGTVYVVQEGDTLLSIIYALGVDPADFLRANADLLNQIELQPGMELAIP